MKKLLCLLLCLAFPTQAAAARLSDPVPFRDLAPAPVTAPTPTPAAEAPVTAPEFLTDRGFTKGVLFYTEFPRVPDLLSHGNLYGTGLYVTYPKREERFYYYDNPNQGYVYRSNVYGFLNVPDAALAAYKEYLLAIGFAQVEDVADEYGFEEYARVVSEELLYAPSFKLDPQGVFVISDYVSQFLWLLIGHSKDYDLAGNLVDCVEFRLYSLTEVPRTAQNLGEFVQDAVKDISPRLINTRQAPGVSVYQTLPNGTLFLVPARNTWQVQGQVPDASAYVPPEDSAGLTQPALPPADAYTAPPDGSVSGQGPSDFTRRLNEQLLKDMPKE